jgi:hypothetical protein
MAEEPETKFEMPPDAAREPPASVRRKRRTGCGWIAAAAALVSLFVLALIAGWLFLAPGTDTAVPGVGTPRPTEGGPRDVVILTE